MGAPFAPSWPDAGTPSYPSYPTVDASQYAGYSTPQPVPPHPYPPQPATAKRAALRLDPVWPVWPVWRRWLLIGGTAVAAIVAAFVIAWLVRGSPRAEPRAVTSGGHVIASPSPAPAPAADRASRGAPGSEPATGGSAGPKPAPKADLKADSTAVASAPSAPSAGSNLGHSVPAPPDDGAASAGGTQVVGSGPCRVTVVTTPAASIVRLDDVAVGPSPLTIASTCEKHKIELSHARYQGLTRWVTLSADRPQELDVSLPRPIHAVTITSFPTGAELSIDGHRAGTTPTVVQMMGFATVNLTFTKAGFQSVTRKVYSKLPQDHVFVKLMK
jgi:hypothetical protein